jgi:hypothetical protein
MDARAFSSGAVRRDISLPGYGAPREHIDIDGLHEMLRKRSIAM